MAHTSGGNSSTCQADDTLFLSFVQTDVTTQLRYAD
jgi:hypothetical protein